MNNKNIKLTYSVIGAFMLVLLQTNVFQEALSYINLEIPSLKNIIFLLINTLSFVGAIIFIISSLILIKNNFNFKDE